MLKFCANDCDNANDAEKPRARDFSASNSYLVNFLLGFLLSLRAHMGGMMTMMVFLFALFPTQNCAFAASDKTEKIEILQLSARTNDEGLNVAADYEFELNPRLEEALQRGVRLYFLSTLRLKRARWYWLDENMAEREVSMRLSYNSLLRQYQVAQDADDGTLQQRFENLKDALAVIKRLRINHFLERGMLKSGERYALILQVKLDVSQLPKPFQINAINNHDWTLVSDTKLLNFNANASVNVSAGAEGSK